MSAPLCILFVAKPNQFLSKSDSLHLENCEQICREFGGKFIRTISDRIPQSIAEIAEREHVTQIVIGESQQSWWKILLGRSFTEQILRLVRAREIDLHIIATERAN